MDPLHPKLVHLPLGVGMVLPFILLGVAVAVHRGLLPSRAWWAAAALAAVTALGAVAGSRSGEAEEDRVERHVAESLLEEHEHAGQRFTVVASLSAVVAIAAGFVRASRVRLAVGVFSGLAAFIALGLGVRAGHLGGELVYRHGAANAYLHGAGKAPAPPSAHGDEDRD